MSDIQYPKVGQGPAAIASEEDLKKDKLGYTHPNLHRRVDPQQPAEDSGEVSPRDYRLGIYSVNSYRTTRVNTHDEESSESEVP